MPRLKKEPSTPRLKKADLQALLDRERSISSKYLDASVDAEEKVGRWQKREKELEQQIASDRKDYRKITSDLKQQIHGLELHLARANGYIDKIKDDYRTQSGGARIVQPEIREALQPNGPGEEYAPGVPDRSHDRVLYEMRNGESESNKPWWAR